MFILVSALRAVLHRPLKSPSRTRRGRRQSTCRPSGHTCAKPREILALGKALFYRQLETGLEAAYADASETMTANALLPAAISDIEVFIGKRRAPDREEKEFVRGRFPR